MKYILTLFLLNLTFSLFTQTNQKNENSKDSIYLEITTIEKISRHPLAKVAILTDNNDTLVLSNEKGKARVKVLKKTKYFTATHSGHSELQFRPKRDFIFNKKIGSVVMTPIDTMQYGDFWKNKKQSVSLCPNEFVNIALGVRYLYFFSRQQSVGTHLSLYAAYNPLNVYIPKENYGGFKLSALYQYYLLNNYRGGIYIEPKISFGYFNARNITYYGGEDETPQYSDKYWTVGIGTSFGFLFYIKNSVILGFSLGVQYFPSGAPDKIVIDGQEYSRISRDIFYTGPPYWETFGPGAIIEFKLFIGMKF